MCILGIADDFSLSDIFLENEVLVATFEETSSWSSRKSPHSVSRRSTGPSRVLVWLKFNQRRYKCTQQWVFDGLLELGTCCKLHRNCEEFLHCYIYLGYTLYICFIVQHIGHFWPEAVPQPRILFGKVQSMTSSVTAVVLSPTVPSVYFLTVENWYKAPLKILECFFWSMASSASFWLRHWPEVCEVSEYMSVWLL